MNQFDNFEKFLQKEFEHFEGETTEQSWEQIREKLHPKPKRRILGFWLLPFFALLATAYLFYPQAGGEKAAQQPAGSTGFVRSNVENSVSEPSEGLSLENSVADYADNSTATPERTGGKDIRSLLNKPVQSAESKIVREKPFAARSAKITAAKSALPLAENTAEKSESPEIEIAANELKKPAQREVLSLADAIATIWPANVECKDAAVELPNAFGSLIKPLGKQKNKGVRLTGSVGLCTNYQQLSANSADNFYVSNVNAPELLSANRMGIQASIGLKIQLSRKLSLRPALNYQGFSRSLDYLVYENELKSWNGVSFGNSYELSAVEFKNTQIHERNYRHSIGLQTDLLWSFNKRDALSVGAGIGRFVGHDSAPTQWLSCSWQHRAARYTLEPFAQYSLKKYAGLNKYYYYQPISFGIKFGF